MKNILPFLLLGALSLLFAEVLSGSSKIWYINPISITLLLSVYLGQLIFFFWIAKYYQRTSLSALYFFGVIFGLYESWITKVLWDGYQASEGPGMGLFLGVGIGEFPMLVFFWHPLMSFIAPFLTFEVLSGSTIITHKKILQKSRRKDVLLAIFIILSCSFLAANNQYSLFSSNMSLLGTLLIVLIIFLACKKFDINDLILNKKKFVVLSVFIVLLYILSFFFITPERLPTTIIPYLTILASYAVVIMLLVKAPRTSFKLVDMDKGYTPKILIWFALIAIVAVNFWCIFPQICDLVLVISYVLFMILGIILFLFSAYSVLVANTKTDGWLREDCNE